MKKLSVRYRVVGGFVIAFLVLLFSGAQMYRSLQGYDETAHWVTESYKALNALHSTMLELYDLESRQRAYIITGEADYLADDEEALRSIRATLTNIEVLTADSTAQQAGIKRLTQLVEDRLEIMNKNVVIFRNEGFAAARERLKTDIPLLTREALQTQAALFEKEERALLLQRVAQAKSMANQAQVEGAFLVMLALIGLGVFWFRIQRELQARQDADTLMHESELLKQIIDLLPVGVFVTDALGAITQINHTARELWGGVQRGDGTQFGGYVAYWPETGKQLEPHEWALHRAIKTGETVHDELMDIRCFDGTRKIIASHAMPIRDQSGKIISAMAVQVDVTEFKRSEQQILATARFDETQARAVALFATGFDRSKILDGLLKLLANQHGLPVSAIYGFDEWSGRYECEASHGLSGSAQRAFVLGEGMLGQAALNGHSTLLDCANLTLQTGLADFAPTQVMMVPVGHQERRLAVLVVASSHLLVDGDQVFLERLAVTLGVALDNLRQYNDLKLLAQRLRSSSEEIVIKNRQLEETSRMKSEFLANMSHELRTPLNAIIGFSEVMRDGLLGEITSQQKEYVNDIFTSGTHLLSLINDILDLSKVEAGKMTLELEPLQLTALVQSSLQVVREKAIAHHIRLLTELGEMTNPLEPGADLLGDIWLDQRKVKQIIYNLLSNAVKFTPDGGEVHIAARQVGKDAVSNPRFDLYLELSVSDTGIGISAADQARLFQPFVQIDSTLGRRYSGTGLGLVMIKRLAELHGGAVGLHSELGKGSTFTVWLPWRTQADAPTIDAMPVPAQLPSTSPDVLSAMATRVSPAATEQPLVLVVEDDDSAAELLRLQLQDIGFRVVRTANAEAALEMAALEIPDLLTLDIHLPGMDGWEFLERFKQQERFAGVPVVIVSIVADKGRGMSLGASQVLQKPISREEFSRALAAIGFSVGPEADPEQRTVLVVDDDPKAVQLLGAYLTPAGYQVLSAFGGQEGIDVARQQRPNLIVLDLMMPEVNGFDVVDALKGDINTATIPIVIVTAKQITAEDRALLEGAVLKVIQKSEFKQVGFIDEVKRAMRGKGG
jgi:PAS domain S-box-containing protein